MSVFDSPNLCHGWNIAQAALVVVHASIVLRHPAPSPAQLVMVPTHALLAVLLSPGLLPSTDPSSSCCSSCSSSSSSSSSSSTSRSIPPSPSPSSSRSTSRSTASLRTPSATPPRTPPKRRPPSTPPTTDTGWRPTVTPQPYNRVLRRRPPPSPLPRRAATRTLPALDALLPHLDYGDLLRLRAVSRAHRASVDRHFHRALMLTHVGTRAVGRSLSVRTWGRRIPRLALPRSLSLPSSVRALHLVNGAAPLRVLRGLDILRVGLVQHVTHPAPVTVVMAPPVTAGPEWVLTPRYEWPALGDGVLKLVSTILYAHASLMGTEDAPHTLLPPQVAEVVLHISRASPGAPSQPDPPHSINFPPQPNGLLTPPTDPLPPLTDRPSPSILVVRPLHGRGPRHVLRLMHNVTRPRLRHGTVSTVLAEEPAYDGQPKVLDDWARAIARNLAPGRVFTLVGSEAWHPLWLAAGLSEEDTGRAGAACSLRLRFAAEVSRQARVLHDWTAEEAARKVEESVLFLSRDAYCIKVGSGKFELETRW